MSNLTVNTISPRTTSNVDITGIDKPTFQGSPLALDGEVLKLAGGTMTGPLILSGDATGSLNPVSFQQLGPAITTAISSIISTGTFTPGFAINGSSSGVTYSQRDGRYLKISNWVIGDAYIVLSNKGGSSGQVTITGLPFAANGVFAFRCSVDNFSITNEVVGFTTVGQTTLTLRQFNGTSGDNLFLSESNITNTALIHVNFTYSV